MTRIGFFQFAPQTRTVYENCTFIVKSLEKERDCLIVLPELFLQSYQDFECATISELEQQMSDLITLSKSNQLAFVGSLPVKIGQYCRNRSFYIQNGNLEQIADKQKLFAHEQKIFKPGPSTRSHHTYKNLQFTACICLDVLEPSIAQAALKKGADLFIVSATVGADFLRTLTKARSLENQMITIFANRSGTEVNGATYLGNCAVFLPDGSERTVDNIENAFITIEITNKDLTAMRQQRKSLQIL